MFCVQDSKIVHVEFGSWTFEVTKSKNLNFRKAANLVTRLKWLIFDCQIEKGSEVFIITDNAVVKSTYFKGSTKVRPLHDMIVQLRKLELEGKLIVDFTWCSGSRMISQGTDGLLRRELATGVMQGKTTLDFLPLNESAFQHYPTLKKNIWTWVSYPQDWRFLNTQDWFNTFF